MKIQIYLFFIFVILSQQSNFNRKIHRTQHHSLHRFSRRFLRNGPSNYPFKGHTNGGFNDPWHQNGEYYTGPGSMKHSMQKNQMPCNSCAQTVCPGCGAGCGNGLLFINVVKASIKMEPNQQTKVYVAAQLMIGREVYPRVFENKTPSQNIATNIVWNYQSSQELNLSMCQEELKMSFAVTEQNKEQKIIGRVIIPLTNIIQKPGTWINDKFTLKDNQDVDTTQYIWVQIQWRADCCPVDQRVPQVV